MANAFLNAYMNNPTAGGTDGTLISQNGDMTSPLTVTLDASISETKIVTLALRCESGYETSGNVTITDSGDTNDKWKLSLDGETWTDSITFTDTITTTNAIFYAKATSDVTELPSNDTSVTLAVTSKIVAV